MKEKILRKFENKKPNDITVFDREYICNNIDLIIELFDKYGDIRDYWKIFAEIFDLMLSTLREGNYDLDTEKYFYYFFKHNNTPYIFSDIILEDIIDIFQKNPDYRNFVLNKYYTMFEKDKVLKEATFSGKIIKYFLNKKNMRA